MKNKFLILSVSLLTLLVSGCWDDSRSTHLQDRLATDSNPDSMFIAEFDPANSVIPFPNNLLFAAVSGSDGSVAQAADGTVNVPYKATDDDASVKAALSALDGFSTTAPITTTFNSTIDAASVIGSVRVFEVTLSGVGGAVVAINRELLLDDEFATVAKDKTLAIVPMKPLKPKTSYLVTVSKGLMGRNGDAAKPSIAYALAKRTSPLFDGTHSTVAALDDISAQKFEAVRQLTNFAESAVEGYTVTNDVTSTPDLLAADIVLSWSFTTQSITDVMNAVYSAAVSATPVSSVTSTAIAELADMVPGANVYEGTLSIPYYLDAEITPTHIGPLTGHWQSADGREVYWANPVVPKSTTQTIPLLLSVPKTAKPGAGWPVVIFQHGITRSRADMLTCWRWPIN
ncbi:MAG: Ig-like domain-containing protein [Gammaproteobacteria bacterium]|nr:Ig-like domain-containing protein [Gammaproteobacteria bacterium]